MSILSSPTLNDFISPSRISFVLAMTICFALIFGSSRIVRLRGNLEPASNGMSSHRLYQLMWSRNQVWKSHIYLLHKIYVLRVSFQDVVQEVTMGQAGPDGSP